MLRTHLLKYLPHRRPTINTMKRFLLIGDSFYSYSPFIKNYIEVLEQAGIPYDYLYWNWSLDDTCENPKNYIAYNKYNNPKSPYWKKFYKIYCFSRFIRKHLRINHYSGVIVFTIAHTLFIQNVLINQYHNHYVFDIRDYSPILKIGLFRYFFKKIICHSAYTVLSSAGFLSWLPDIKGKYIIDHNTNANYLIKHFGPTKYILSSPKTKILTIGQLRDAKSNKYVIDSLLNSPYFELNFAGLGWALPQLHKHALKKGAKNISFTGQYDKTQEADIVNESDMINIYLNNSTNSNTLMSNRFYLSVIHCKPMIVNDGGYQAKICKKYKLGVVIEQGGNIAERIIDYKNNFNIKEYLDGRSKFLKEVLCDLNKVHEKIIELSLYKNS